MWIAYQVAFRKLAILFEACARIEEARVASPISKMKINLLALMNDLDIVAVRIEHPCRIIARIVFGPSLR